MPPLSIHTVLVLDDDEVMRDLLDALLTCENYQVTLAASGSEALAALGTKTEFDLILTDLQMPHLEGEPLIRTLLAAMPSHALLIGMSGNEVAPSTLEQLDGFVAKPFDIEQLEQTIRTAGRQRITREASTSVEPPVQAPTSASGNVASLDEAILRSLARLIPRSQLAELYNMMLGDVAKRYGRMQEAAAAGDLAAVRREAHTMKGSCGMVGAAELQALAAAVEGGTTLNTFAMTEIPAACERLRRMLSDKLQTV